MKTEKIEGEGPIWAFALYTAAFPSDELFGNFTVREYAKAVGKLGGISSQGVNLLKPDRHVTVPSLNLGHVSHASGPPF